MITATANLQSTISVTAQIKSVQVGTCADATVQLNGTTVGTIASGATDSFEVNLNGSPSGVWDGTAWQVTSTPCADATVENTNQTFQVDIPSGGTEVLENYEFEFQDPTGVVIATEIRPAMIPQTFNFATGITYTYNVNINGVFYGTISVTAGDDINITT